MPSELPMVIFWCLVTSLMALAYGEYASLRQSWGRPISVKERFRNVMILYAIAFSLAALAVVVWTSLPLQYVFGQLQGVASFAFAPILLWYAFDLPLRLARHLSRPRRTNAVAGHPLDGAWSDTTSFLDKIAEHQGRSRVDLNQEPGVDGLAPGMIKTSGDVRLPALERVARLGRVEPPPTGSP